MLFFLSEDTCVFIARSELFGLKYNLRLKCIVCKLFVFFCCSFKYYMFLLCIHEMICPVNVLLHYACFLYMQYLKWIGPQ